jgi:hypothetical protein
MTVGDWLARRTPSPPPALRARLHAALGEGAITDDLNVTETCLAAAERVLVDLLHGECISRDSALDLLTADALVTYAFEAAGESSEDFASRATDAMRRFAALGVAHREQAVAE